MVMIAGASCTVLTLLAALVTRLARSSSSELVSSVSAARVVDEDGHLDGHVLRGARAGGEREGQQEDEQAADCDAEPP
jgi:hypothetical protein